MDATSGWAARAVIRPSLEAETEVKAGVPVIWAVPCLAAWPVRKPRSHWLERPGASAELPFRPP